MSSAIAASEHQRPADQQQVVGNTNSNSQAKGQNSMRQETEAEREARKAKERAARRVGVSFEEVEDRYNVESRIGSGTYGMVFRATKRETGEAVAIKKCKDVFSDASTGKRILRELKLLSYFNHENILRLKDVPAPKQMDFSDIYIVTEMLDFDLGKVIYSPQVLAEDHYSYFLYQILKGLLYVHQGGVIHRDLKPQNILVMENCDCKLCDFGLSRPESEHMTSYVVTRWYRAPELLLQQGTRHYTAYTSAIDVWSVGCILVEIITRQPLFEAKGEINMLKAVINVVPVPDDDEFFNLPWVKGNHGAARLLRESRGVPAGKPLRSIIEKRFQNPQTFAHALDMLEKMLQWDPRKRPSVAQLLEHPYLAHLRNPETETVPPAPFKFEQDTIEVSSSELRRLFVEEIRKHHPEAFRQPQNKSVAPLTTAMQSLHSPLMGPSNGASSAASSSGVGGAPVEPSPAGSSDSFSSASDYSPSARSPGQSSPW